MSNQEKYQEQYVTAVKEKYTNILYVPINEVDDGILSIVLPEVISKDVAPSMIDYLYQIVYFYRQPGSMNYNIEPQYLETIISILSKHIDYIYKYSNLDTSLDILVDMVVYYIKDCHNFDIVYIFMKNINDYIRKDQINDFDRMVLIKLLEANVNNVDKYFYFIRLNQGFKIYRKYFPESSFDTYIKEYEKYSAILHEYKEQEDKELI